ncbi:MAG: ParA family protein [Coriobacteriales bacterium]
MAAKVAKRGTSAYMSEESIEKLNRMKKATGQSTGELFESLLEEKAAKDGEDAKRPTIYVVTSYKGGVGKSTTAACMAVCFGQAGDRVLVIDMDGQGNLSEYMGIIDADGVQDCIANVMLPDRRGQFLGLNDIIKSTAYENVDIAPSSIAFASGATDLEKDNRSFREFRLADAIRDLDAVRHYDKIIIDCPPAINLIAMNAVNAISSGNAESMVIIPVKTEMFSIKGVKETLDLIDQAEKVAARIKPVKYQRRVLFTIVEKNTTVYKTCKDIIAEELPGLEAFKTEIPKTTVVPESTVAYQVLVTYDPSNAASRAYAKLCEEIDNA